MEDARTLALQGAPAGAGVRADSQTLGRGRAGRAWASPAGGLWMSVILRPTSPPERWTVLPLAAGCAVVEALGESSAVCRLKWPNDVLHEGKKLAGVLVETRAPAFAVVGVGANVGVLPEDLPPEVRPHAAAVPMEPRVVDALAEGVRAGILARAQQLDREGSAGLLDEWRRMNTTLGARVDRAGAHGVAIDVDETGALIVASDDGTTVRLTEAS